MSSLDRSQIIALSAGLVCTYVLWPTISDWAHKLNPFPVLSTADQQMLLKKEKRLGKHTVGLVNASNLCFINSNIQSFAGIPNLYTYLAQIQYLLPSDSPQLAPLSIAVGHFMALLNEPVYGIKTISALPLIQTIEAIYKSRISRNQHDAHEMLQLMLETMADERLALYKHYSSQRTEDGLVPEFPFSGTLVDKIVCQRCKHVTLRPNEFLVLPLVVPQKTKTALEHIIDSIYTPEIITDYGCTNCRMQAVLGSSDSQLQELKGLLGPYANTPEAIPEELESQLPSYITGPIEKSQQLGRLPSVLCIHLARSIFTVNGAARNQCRVSFPAKLDLMEQDPVTKARRIKKYKLCAMVRHSGTHQSGHYECCRLKNLKFWYGSLAGVDFSDSLIDLNKSNHSSGAPSTRTGASSGSDLHESNSLGSTSFESNSLESNSFESNSLESSNGILPFPDKAAPSTGISLSSASLKPSHKESATSSDVLNGSSWWAISDSRERETSTRVVLGQEKAVYLLFYEEVSDEAQGPSSTNVASIINSLKTARDLT